MGYETSLSAKGQIVIPKDVRDSLALAPGQRFDIEAAGGAVILRPKAGKSGRTTHEILAELHARYPYTGPRVSIDEMNETIRQSWIEAGERSDV